ncbi:phosphopantothenoylcysteine decarboxylase [Myxococcota bacterium]|nr:phosphopantothenoylcysteine decarboxylase [Myxococcota bacterium]
MSAPQVIITAGATRNPIDAMRYISARSSGTTSLWLARALTARGVAVHLLGSAEALLRAGPGDVASQEEFGSTRDLMARLERLLLAHPGAAVIHAAAVGDYEAEPRADKIRSGQALLTLSLRPTPKILDHIKGWSPESFLVSFKAAGPGTTTEGLQELCEGQRQRTSSDLVLGNVLGALGSTTALCDAAGFTPMDDRDAALATIVHRVAEAVALRRR